MIKTQAWNEFGLLLILKPHTTITPIPAVKGMFEAFSRIIV